MKLRPWQADCVNSALKTFKKNPSFLCLATPAAGKSHMAAELAKRLLDGEQIDMVLCFSPSCIVANSLRDKFAQHLGCRFDGAVGAIGGSYTYQSLPHIDDQFWQIFDTHRVLVIFDEIHHCAGSNQFNGNVWGSTIISRIQGKAKYTLTLTGTPWRSDCLPIAMANYDGADKEIECNFEYSLADAVRDNVCRVPNIVLIDNSKITITDGGSESKPYKSFSELLKSKEVNYQAIIRNEQAITYMLKSARRRLTQLKRTNPQAAGLVVASSVRHAQQIAEIIRSKLNASVELVNYTQPDALSKIEAFKTSNIEWIVSIGMISEGTDIPRLQVCCHLSHIKTELYYRQVLGRILRKTNNGEEHAWIYTFAETQLVEFAKRIDESIPERKLILEDDINNALGENNNSADSQSSKDSKGGKTNTPPKDGTPPPREGGGGGSDESNEISLTMLGRFRQEVLSVFESPF